MVMHEIAKKKHARICLHRSKSSGGTGHADCQKNMHVYAYADLKAQVAQGAQIAKISSTRTNKSRRRWQVMPNIVVE